MPGKPGGTPATQLARDYGVSLNEFASAVIDVVDAPGNYGPAGDRGARRREICAAVSAAMMLALDASTLTEEERAALQPLISDVLVPFWSKHCAAHDADAAAYIASRAPHYMARRVPGSQIKTAVNIVNALLDELEVPASVRAALIERLAPAFAHRMVGDVYRINEVRSKYGIELSVMATVCALLQMSMTYDPILRVLRLV